MARIRIFAVLLGVLAAVVAGSAPASAADLSVSQAQQQLNQAQARLNEVNNQLEHAQGQLDAATRTLAEDQKVETQLDTELAAIARYQYAEPALPIRLFRAASFSAALAEIAQTRIVGARQRALLARQRQARARDQKARDTIAQEVKTIQAAQKQAQQIAAQAQTALEAAKADEVRQQAAAVAAQARATVVSAPAGPVPTGGSVGNHFTYGYCTWYVANRRPIPWFGNAIEWWPNARAYGYAEGSTPRVGAVMVTRESWAGHVAYVESVNPDGSWTVSEMNYVAWGVVSSRTLRYGQVSLVGFIY